MNEIFKDPNVLDLYHKLIFTSTNDPHEDAVSLLEFLSSSKEVSVFFTSPCCIKAKGMYFKTSFKSVCFHIRG